MGHRLAAAYRRGKDVELPGYGGTPRHVRVLSDCGLWYTPGEPPIALRWVLGVDPTDRYAPLAVFSTDLALAVEQIVARVVQRWNVAVTFAESRRHLGVDTQRQWSDLALARTTPALFALFSLVCLIADRLVTVGSALPLRLTAWYRQAEATFSDVLAMVRRALWAEKHFPHSAVDAESILFPRNDWEILLDQLASTA